MSLPEVLVDPTQMFKLVFGEQFALKCKAQKFMSLILGGVGQFIGEALTVILDRVRADCKIFEIRANIGIQSFQ